VDTREELMVVAELFEALSTSRLTEVTSLIGPSATLKNVLATLAERPVDVLHFAGPGIYVPDRPADSGWLLSEEDRLTSRDVSQLERVPSFVYCNAAESALTAAPTLGERSLLKLSFLGAFLRAGTSELVTCGWAVDVQGARDFAVHFYRGLLGLEQTGGGYRRGEPLDIAGAMLHARRAVAASPSGAGTWGAYRHYGHPDFRLVEPGSTGTARPEAAPDSGGNAGSTPSEPQRGRERGMTGETSGSSRSRARSKSPGTAKKGNSAGVSASSTKSSRPKKSASAFGKPAKGSVAPREPAVAAKSKPLKDCFIIAPFGDAGSDIRRRSDSVLWILREAVSSFGYRVIRSDQIDAPGLISHEVIRLLVEAPLVIADLTGANPNVIYELAIRHAVGKPFVQIIAKGERIPFYHADMRTVEIDIADALEARDQIKHAIAAVHEPGYRVTTPISEALGKPAIL
jgi:hypothetical protein